MKVIADTREKTNEHILQYFEKHGIPYTIAKIDTGDYLNTDNPTVRVERKASLGELAHNLLSPDRKRFYNEIRRGRDEGLKLVILCEHGPGIHSIKDIRNWQPKYGKVTGKALADAIFRLEISYQVPCYFCSKRSTGKRIVEILNGEGFTDDYGNDTRECDRNADR